MAEPEIKQQLKQRVLQKIGAMQEQQVQQADQLLAAQMGMMPPAGVGAPGPGMTPPGVPGGAPLVGQPGGPQAGSALGGFGDVAFAGQGMPFAPGGPGMPAVPANAPPQAGLQPTFPGGLPGTPAGSPGFSPGMLVNPNPAQPGIGPFPRG